MRDADKAAASDALLTWLQPENKNPTTRPIDFSACFGGNLSSEARDLLHLATAQRNKLIEVLGASGDAAPPDPRNITAAVEAYLPSLWTITASFEAASTLSVKLTSVKLEFKWVSALAEKPKEWTFGVLIFEVCFVLAIRALAHRNTARIILEANPSAYVDASKELCRAAGIFELVANGLLPRWASAPASRPPEVFAPVALCFAAMCLADAQRLMTAKAVASDAASTLVAKLLVGAEDKYAYATRALQTLDKATFDGTSAVLKEELGAMPPLCRAVASSELAFAAHDKGEYGKAAAYARESARRLGALTALGKNLVRAGLAKQVADARGRSEALANEYENEATTAYFMAVPAVAELAWADGSFIAKPVPYELPDANLVSFSELPLPPTVAKTSRSFFEKLFNISSEFYSADDLQAIEKAKTEQAKETAL